MEAACFSTQHVFACLSLDVKMDLEHSYKKNALISNNQVLYIIKLATLYYVNLLSSEQNRVVLPGVHNYLAFQDI